MFMPDNQYAKQQEDKLFVFNPPKEILERVFPVLDNRTNFQSAEDVAKQFVESNLVKTYGDSIKLEYNTDGNHIKVEENMSKTGRCDVVRVDINGERATATRYISTSTIVMTKISNIM